jgi:hypothetical protein
MMWERACDVNLSEKVRLKIIFETCDFSHVKNPDVQVWLMGDCYGSPFSETQLQTTDL